jgi:GNAT superfamily N-acetyltransferase
MIEIIDANLAAPEHADALVRLLNEYALHPMGKGSELSAHVKANLAAELQARKAHVIFAYVDGMAAGLMVCMEGFSTFACKPLLNIHDVVVTDKHRGKGLAKLMFERAEAIAGKLGCCKMTLEVLEGNRAAQAVYKSLGFAGFELDPKMGKAMFWQKLL